MVAKAVVAAAVSTALSVGSTFMSAIGQRNAGIAENQRAQYVAKQMEVNAGQERAAAQRRAQEQRRRGDLAQSRAQSLAAASGGGALDPSVVDIMGGLEEESEFNALSDLYEGEERARDLESNATVTRWSGNQANKAGYMAARTTMLSGIGNVAGSDSTKTLLEKYG
jgi:hypothetical protein